MTTADPFTIIINSCWEKVFDDEFMPAMGMDPRWNVQGTYQASDAPARPHVMLTIAHELLGDNDRLLYGEIDSIVSIMVTRLERNSFQMHNIIPVSKSKSLVGLSGLLVVKLIHCFFKGDDILLHGQPARQDFASSFRQAGACNSKEQTLRLL